MSVVAWLIVMSFMFFWWSWRMIVKGSLSLVWIADGSNYWKWLN